MKLVKYKLNVSLNTTLGQKMNEFKNNIVFCENEYETNIIHLIYI